MFNLWSRNSSDSQEVTNIYLERPVVSRLLQEALKSRKHMLVYGPARQGKSTIVRRLLAEAKSVTIRASRDTAFGDMFRTYLMTLGCSVTVEQKKRKKLGSKAEIKFQWPLISASGSAEAGVEGEVTLRSFSADINSPNDVCYLIREFGSAPILVVDGLERLRRRQRKTLLESLPIMFDNQALQICLISASSEMPLDYGEQIELSRYISPIIVPPLSSEETAAFADKILSALNCRVPPQLPDFLYDVFQGALESTRDACALSARKLASIQSNGGLIQEFDVRRDLQAEIQDRTKNYFLALTSMLIEKNWTIPYTRRLPHKRSARSARTRTKEEIEAQKAVPVHPALADDEVFQTLCESIHAASQERPEMSKLVSPVFNEAIKLGRRILSTDTDAEAVRYLAFAISALASAPMAQVSDRYRPVHDTALNEANVGRLFCSVLLESDLTQTIVMTSDSLHEFFKSRGYVIKQERYGEPVFAQLAKRVRKVHRSLNTGMSLLKVEEDLSSIVLWNPKYSSIFGDVKSHIKELLDRLDQEEVHEDE